MCPSLNSVPCPVEGMKVFHGLSPTGLLFVGCLTSQQHASVSQGRICFDNCTYCHTETEVTNQMQGAWQGRNWSNNFQVTGMIRPGKRSTVNVGIEPRSAALEGDALTTRPTMQSVQRCITLIQIVLTEKSQRENMQQMCNVQNCPKPMCTALEFQLMSDGLHFCIDNEGTLALLH